MRSVDRLAQYRIIQVSLDRLLPLEILKISRTEISVLDEYSIVLFMDAYHILGCVRCTVSVELGQLQSFTERTEAKYSSRSGPEMQTLRHKKRTATAPICLETSRRDLDDSPASIQTKVRMWYTMSKGHVDNEAVHFW